MTTTPHKTPPALATRAARHAWRARLIILAAWMLACAALAGWAWLWFRVGLVPALHWHAGVLVLLEALYKLERTDTRAALRRGVPWRERAVTLLKVAAWFLLALAGAGAIITPLLHLEAPTLQDAAALGGFAILIIRTRVKESVTGQVAESDDFSQTQVVRALPSGPSAASGTGKQGGRS